MSTAPVEALTREEASAIASLVAMGSQSGATILGLSGVRRNKQLQLVFLDEQVSANTLRELGRRAGEGVRVFRVTGLDVITGRMGRDDVHVLAVKPGALADGILGKLPPAVQDAAQTHEP